MLTVHSMNNTREIEIRYFLLRLLEENPQLSQRQMARRLGVSLGKFNYCLAELVKKGVVKVERFKEARKKIAYLYLLTPHGLEEKARITSRFLKIKLQEYEEIKQLIQQLHSEEESGPTHAEHPEEW